jgi:hypothetical protein
MGTGTYGHHWKEYSAAEMRTYFSLLSDDFQVVRTGSLDLEPVPLSRRFMQWTRMFIPFGGLFDPRSE